MTALRRVRRARRSLAVRGVVAGGILLPSVTGLTGCYSYRTTSPEAVPVGAAVALDISDQGRVALGDRLGAGVLRVAGTLEGRTDAQYVLRVAEVRQIGGGTSHWSGERVQLDRAFVTQVTERRFSRARTALIAATVVGAIAAFIVTRSLSGDGTAGGDGKGSPGGGGDT